MKKTIIVILVIIIIALGLWLISSQIKTLSEEKRSAGDQRFGFLIGDYQEMDFINESGAAWARPHPGPFVWGKMQASANSAIRFDQTDRIVKAAPNYQVSLLITLWPYANWDQQNHQEDKNCRFANGEFDREFGDYRCNPYDWDSYLNWISQVVERYDGDGVNDMPQLAQAVKYWEVLNEPDLNWQNNFAEPERLVFFRGTPTDYLELLAKTSEAIKQADPEAKVLIAGAAGSSFNTLDFYRRIIEQASPYFDIANVHCISSDDYGTFNVEPYQNLLQEQGINKPIWVTEAETFISSDPAVNASQLKLSTSNALDLGATKIFYTAWDFSRQPGGGVAKEKGKETQIEIDQDLDPQDPKSTYHQIFQSL